jgi:hypothetical protein
LGDGYAALCAAVDVVAFAKFAPRTDQGEILTADGDVVCLRNVDAAPLECEGRC